MICPMLGGLKARSEPRSPRRGSQLCTPVQLLHETHFFRKITLYRQNTQNRIHLRPSLMFSTMSLTSRSLLIARHIQRRCFSTRPFQILGLQQVAIGGLEKESLTNLWVDVFGLTKVHSFVSESENVDEDILTLGEHPHALEIDLMTPIDAEKSPKVCDTFF